LSDTGTGVLLFLRNIAEFIRKNNRTMRSSGHLIGTFLADRNRAPAHDKSSMNGADLTATIEA
jgi:hypothetical protein